MGSIHRDVADWKNFLKPMFEFPKLDQVEVSMSAAVVRSFSFSEVTTDSAKYSWFVSMFDKSGLPEFEAKLYKILGNKNDETSKQIRQSIDKLSVLRQDIRNFHNNIYSGLFNEPKFRDIPAFGKALEQFWNKKMKIKRVKKIYKEADKIKISYDKLIEKLDEKMQDIPLKRFDFFQLSVSIKKRLQGLEKSKNKAFRLNEISNIVEEAKAKMEELKNVLSDASSVAIEFSIQRAKWAETLLGEPIVPKGSKLKLLRCFGMPQTK